MTPDFITTTDYIWFWLPQNGGPDIALLPSELRPRCGSDCIRTEDQTGLSLHHKREPDMALTCMPQSSTLKAYTKYFIYNLTFITLSSSSSLKTVPPIWLGLNATQFNAGNLYLVFILFLIVTADVQQIGKTNIKYWSQNWKNNQLT